MISYYVDPTYGHDANAGTTVGTAVRTIEKARQLVSLVNDNMTDDIKVYLRGGVYYIDEPIIFTPSDSGTNGYKIYYTAYSGEQPILSGGVKLAGLNWVADTGFFNRYSAAITDPGVPNFVELYVGISDEKLSRAIRARHPNKVDEETLGNCFVTRGAYIGPGHEEFTSADAHISDASDSLAIKYTDFQDISNRVGSGSIEDAELVLLQHYYHDRLRISSTSTENDLTYLTFRNPEGSYFTSYAKSTLFFYDCPYYFENALGFIDTSDEWFLDMPVSGDRTLYYRIRAGEMSGSQISEYSFVVPKVKTLIQLAGTSDNSMVEDLVFSGLVFRHTAWRIDGRDPSGAGLVATQAMQIRGAPSVGEKVSAAFQAKYSRRIAITNNEFTQLGGSAIDFSTCVRNTKITYNNITDIAASGICLDTDITASLQGTVIPGEESYGLTIANNYIKGVGRLYTNAVGIWSNFVSDSYIEYNEILSSRYMGIQMGNFISGHQDVPQGNNRIQYNYISGVMTTHDDGAAIYTLARQKTMMSPPGRSSYIFENTIANMTRNPFSAYDTPPAYPFPMVPIYLDNNTEYAVVNNNYYTNINHDSGGLNVYEHFQLGAQNNIYSNANTSDSHVVERAGLTDYYFEPLADQIFDLDPEDTPLDWGYSTSSNGVVQVAGASSLVYPGSAVPQRCMEMSQTGGGYAYAWLSFDKIKDYGSIILDFNSSNLLNYKKLIYLYSSAGNQLALSVAMSGGSLVVYDGAVTQELLTNLQSNEWYRLRVDFDVKGQSFDLYFLDLGMQEGSGFMQLLLQNEPFRNAVNDVGYFVISAAEGSYNNTLSVDNVRVGRLVGKHIYEHDFEMVPAGSQLPTGWTNANGITVESSGGLHGQALRLEKADAAGDLMGAYTFEPLHGRVYVEAFLKTDIASSYYHQRAVYLRDSIGKEVVRVAFHNGYIQVQDDSGAWHSTDIIVEPNTYYKIGILADTVRQVSTVYVNGRASLSNIDFCYKTCALNRYLKTFNFGMGNYYTGTMHCDNLRIVARE